MLLHHQILLRGRHVFMGYLNNEQKTVEAIDDEGWLHTGDVGKVDKVGLGMSIVKRITMLYLSAMPLPADMSIC